MIKETNGKKDKIEFDSLNDFCKYMLNTPFNTTFKNEHRSSESVGLSSFKFTQTSNFEEAMNLLKNGWDDMANKLTNSLKAIEKEVKPAMKSRSCLSVTGYQAVVPLYLQGVPNNMVNKKMTPMKQKVVTLNKSINYSCGVKSETIINESIKTLQIVKKLEAQGYRCNLNVIFVVSESTKGLSNKNEKTISVKVRIKSANEKLNISKVAFPLVHPSMLRRLFFRFIEVYPETPASFLFGYGYPEKNNAEVRKLYPNEYLLPAFINKDVNSIKDLRDLENM